MGPHGEAVIDLLAGDAVRSGFGRIVLVLHPESGPSVRYHVEQCWPSAVDVAFVEQRLPLGTTTRCSRAGPPWTRRAPFGVSNADDVYGEAAMRLLVDHLRSGADEHALVGFALGSTVSTPTR